MSTQPSSPLPALDSEAFLFRFKTIKDLAKPGAWRRGYGYYKTAGQVMSVEVTDTGVAGQVKGNYKDAYLVTVDLTQTPATPTCDCPLDEVWCKHAVAVALTAVKTHQVEAFLKIPPQDFIPCEPPKTGIYQVNLDFARHPRSISLQLKDCRTNTIVENVSVLWRGISAFQQDGPLDLNPAQQYELNLIKFLHQKGIQDKADKEPDDDHADSTGWVHIGGADQERLFTLLQSLESLCDAQTQGRITFAKAPLQLLLSINASMVGNVLLALNWIQAEPIEDVFPLDEIKTFGKDSVWGYTRHRFYSLSTALKNLPAYLTRGAFYDVRDADGGKFLFEELPQLRDHVAIEQSEVIDKATLEQEPPKNMMTLRIVGELTLRGELDFMYEQTRTPYSKANEAPFVTVTDAQKDSIYWLKRDKKAEQRAFSTLQKSHMQPVQSNHFSAEDDDAIDFYNLERPALEAQGWVFETEDDLSVLSLSPDPLRIVVKLDFTADSVDQFTMAVSCGIGEESLDLDTVQGFFIQGKKYILIDGKGFVEIPLAAILQFTKTLNSFDKEFLDKDVYLIKTYQAGLITELMEQGVDVVMSPRFQAFWDLVASFSTLEEVDVPAEVQADLRPYQKQGFNWLWFLYSYGLNGILADDMGLGKTLQTLTLLQKAKDEDGAKPSLIICPTSVVYNWQKEAQRFTPDLSLLNLTGPERHHLLKEIAQADIVLTSFALLRRDIKILRQFPFRYAILDESQNIKNHESQTAQASKNLNAQHRLALSGTPIENRLSEVWSTFDFLMPGFLLDKDQFRQRYATPIEEKGNREAERRLKKQMSPFILRRLKRDVAKDLPDKIENVQYCELLPEQQALYMQVLEETRNQVFAQYNIKGQVVNQASVLTALLRLRQICCDPQLLKDENGQKNIGSGKLEALEDLLEEIISEGHRILLFSQFVEMLKIIEKWVKKKGIRYEMLTGDTDPTDRQTRVDRFNTDEGIPLFLISLKAGGTGLNLTGADYVIHYDPWWNPAAEDQATDRAYRIGQTKNVMVYRLVTRGTIEEKIMALKDRKKDLVDSVISVDRDLSKKFTFDDLKEILTPDF